MHGVIEFSTTVLIRKIEDPKGFIPTSFNHKDQLIKLNSSSDSLFLLTLSYVFQQ